MGVRPERRQARSLLQNGRERCSSNGNADPATLQSQKKELWKKKEEELVASLRVELSRVQEEFRHQTGEQL